MKTAFFFVFIAFILACGLVFCEEYKTEFEDEDKTELGDIDKTEFEDEDKTELENEDKTEFEDEDKTEFDDKSAEVDDPRKRLRCFRICKKRPVCFTRYRYKIICRWVRRCYLRRIRVCKYGRCRFVTRRICRRIRVCKRVRIPYRKCYIRKTCGTVCRRY